MEKEKSIPFDAGLLHKIKRQIIIRIQCNNTTYTFESDLDVLKKIANGHRHRVKSFYEVCFILNKFFVLVFFHTTSSS